MKKIEAYIQPFMLQKVEDALRTMHIHGMSITEIKGFGKEKDDSYPHRVTDYAVNFTPKIKIEIICSDADCPAIAGAIRASAHTGRKGDGKIFIFDVQEAVSIRTGDKGEKAI